MKQEFERLINTTVTNGEYEVIETVYMHYPTATGEQNFTNKKQFWADLYSAFGMRIFNDMANRAFKVKELEDEIRKAKMEISNL